MQLYSIRMHGKIFKPLQRQHQHISTLFHAYCCSKRLYLFR